MNRSGAEGENRRKDWYRLPALIVATVLVLIWQSCASGPILKSSRKEKAEEAFEQATFFFKQGEYPNALKLYQEAEKLYPEFPEVNHRIGLCYAKTRFYAQARDAFLKELSINPGHLDAHLDLGLIYVSLRQYEQAENEYRRVLERDSDNYKGHLNLAILLITHLGRREEGIQHLKEYVSRAPFSRKRSRIEAWIAILLEESGTVEAASSPPVSESDSTEQTPEEKEIIEENAPSDEPAGS